MEGQSRTPAVTLGIGFLAQRQRGEGYERASAVRASSFSLLSSEMFWEMRLGPSAVVALYRELVLAGESESGAILGPTVERSIAGAEAIKGRNAG